MGTFLSCSFSKAIEVVFILFIVNNDHLKAYFQAGDFYFMMNRSQISF